MATRAQLALIHIGKKALGLDDDSYRASMEQVAGVRSAKDLTGQKAGQFIDWMHRQGAPLATREQSKRQSFIATGRMAGPSDGGETINKKQMDCIDAFRQYLGWDQKRLQIQSQKICKQWWPQNRAQGVALTLNLIAISAEQILRNIRFLDKTQLTQWERGFLYFNQPNALDEFARYVGNKNRRGARRMPNCSLLKLFEILKTRPTKKPLAVGREDIRR